MTGAERQLTLRVLSALLREDVLGLRSGAALERRADGPWLRSGRFGLPVVADGFQCAYAARLPLLAVDGVELTGLPDILARLAEEADPPDRPGHLAFAEECRQTLATMELHERVRDGVHERLAETYGADPARWSGLGPSLAFDTLAAYLDHPVYPTARGRSGLTVSHLTAYAPEFHPSFELRWLAVPPASWTRTAPGRCPTGGRAPAGSACTAPTRPFRCIR
ncbi:siderophore biosynthesis protein [Kitasatospora cheerisanensis KCTC 2395]|uniref:Siderophore biosynthesis protein n=1 Tax=Kitasatospora cheerisanensis KCTC 2395 TaxID=1348663 RepID=A0A066YIY8_9ACTN|nr:siderophore biosynthesis protein [Kitasatospora cheerisanensis KCTC 2395]